MDASNAYLFRGIPQDDTGLILWPAADLGVAFSSGRRHHPQHHGERRDVEQPAHGHDRLRRPERQAVVRVGFLRIVRRWSPEAVSPPPRRTRPIRARTACSRPSRSCRFRVGVPVYGVSSYALVAFELDGQADGGLTEGQVSGTGRRAGLRRHRTMTVTVPVKVGLSLGTTTRGCVATSGSGSSASGPASPCRCRASGRASADGTCTAALEYVRLGDSNALRLGDNTKVIISAGIGFSY